MSLALWILVFIRRANGLFSVPIWLMYFHLCQGESFYNPYIPNVIKELTDKGLVEESQGARVIFIDGINIPLIVVKSDGGFNYASTDLAAIWSVFLYLTMFF